MKEDVAGASKDSRYRRAWEWPECPACDSDVFVSHSQNRYSKYICYHCQEQWGIITP